MPHRLIGQAADVGFVTPHNPAEARAVVAEIQAAGAQAGRGPETISVLADLVVFLASDARAAADRRARLDELAGQELTSDAAVFAGTPAQLASVLEEWQQAGLSGFRLRPGGIPADLQAITRDLVPELQRRGVFRTSYDAGTLRGRLGLGRPASRYAASGRS
jgi:alkanesulfonate monooxygenase SsuD/methylene tetrahydromethanopterin reductase-like flavin-dependent oxidoreductase (luciferase family)